MGSTYHLHTRRYIYIVCVSYLLGATCYQAILAPGEKSIDQMLVDLLNQKFLKVKGYQRLVHIGIFEFNQAQKANLCQQSSLNVNFQLVVIRVPLRFFQVDELEVTLDLAK